MSDAARLISPEKRGEDLDTALRPQSLDEFTGQAEARANLKVFIEAAKNRLNNAINLGLRMVAAEYFGTTHRKITVKQIGEYIRKVAEKEKKAQVK